MVHSRATQRGARATMFFNAVYYPGLWYSRFLNVPLSAFDGNIQRNSVQRQCMHLRLLSLIFDTIYIPRTHLLTHVYSLETDIVGALVQSRDFRFLVDHGAIKISTFPELDERQDSERILARQGLTNSLIYTSEKLAGRVIPASKPYGVASDKESKQNLLTFPHYGNLLKLVDPGLSASVLDKIDHAQLGDVPFFHEHFILSAKESLPKEEFEKVWRDTNSIYLTSPIPLEGGLISYFDEQIESIGFRFEPHGIDRYLFNPSAIYTYMQNYIDSNDMIAFLGGDISSSHRFISSTGERCTAAKGFRTEYFSLVERVSSSIRNQPAALDLNMQTIRSLFNAALNSGIRSGIDIALAAADDIRTLGTAGHLPNVGFVGGVAKPVARYGGALIDRWVRSLRRPRTAEFVQLLRADLGPMTS